MSEHIYLRSSSDRENASSLWGDVLPSVALSVPLRECSQNGSEKCSPKLALSSGDLGVHTIRLAWVRKAIWPITIDANFH